MIAAVAAISILYEQFYFSLSQDAPLSALDKADAFMPLG